MDIIKIYFCPHAIEKETGMSKGGRRVRIFSALEVANICGVVNQTAINWIRSGHLKAFTTPGGQYRIYAKDLAAFLDKRGMSASGEVLQVMLDNANWSSLMIAMEQPANDYLKNQLGNLFSEISIIQAFDWFEIGRRIVEVKPGLIILDADLPGADVYKFIQTVKDDPSFGKPFVFLLITAGHESQYSVHADLLLTKPLDLARLEAVLRDFEKQSSAVTA